jgi:ubiquinone/menaquinone biosynthesis C-methylase UbiE
MHLRELQRNWDTFGSSDPLWAILTDPSKTGNRWGIEEFFSTGVAEIQDVMAWLESIYPLPRRRRALDFGCGVGRVTQPLAAFFDEAVGVDVAPSMIRLAVQYNRCGERCRYVLNEAEHLRCFEDETFDLIYSGLTLQHMEPSHAQGYLAEFTRILSPGGAMVFQLPSEPSRSGLKFAFGRFIDHLYVTFYRRVVRRDEPLMRMFSIRREEVLQLMLNRGCAPMVVEPDVSAGPEWIGYRYFVVKPFPAPG